MKIVTLYEIFDWDGGDRHVETGVCFEDKAVAIHYLGDNKYGRIQERTFRIYSTVADAHENKKKEARAKALAKLTTEEKELLGLE